MFIRKSSSITGDFGLLSKAWFRRVFLSFLMFTRPNLKYCVGSHNFASRWSKSWNTQLHKLHEVYRLFQLAICSVIQVNEMNYLHVFLNSFNKQLLKFVCHTFKTLQIGIYNRCFGALIRCFNSILLYLRMQHVKLFCKFLRNIPNLVT